MNAKANQQNPGQSPAATHAILQIDRERKILAIELEIRIGESELIGLRNILSLSRTLELDSLLSIVPSLRTLELKGIPETPPPLPSVSLKQ